MKKLLLTGLMGSCILILPSNFYACQKAGFPAWKENATGIEFILIPKGSFQMGNPSADTMADGTTVHEVTLEKDFWLSRYEITLEQWQKVMGTKELHTEKPNPFRNLDPHFPVVSISYYDIQNFMGKLQKLSPGNTFRLPTEAEWEYACRAGTTTAFSTGKFISDTLANYNAELPSTFSNMGTYLEHPSPVGSYPPNPWGLYDMHGNVWEWVSDWYAPYASKPKTDPKGPESGSFKIIRGGSWYFDADNARSFVRRTHDPNAWGFSIGFRIVRESQSGKGD